MDVNRKTLAEAQVKMGRKIRIWQGWYRHDLVYLLDGKQIGFVQVRQRHYSKRIGSRIDVMTADMGSAGVIGRQLDWLVRRAGEARDSL